MQTPLDLSSILWNGPRRGVLATDDRLEPVGFVVGQGVILVPWVGPVDDGTIHDASLHVPDEGAESVGLQLEARLIDEDREGSGGGGTCISGGFGRLIDRWEGYHGRRGSSRFALCAVDSLKHLGIVTDGDELELVNTLGNEAPLLRRLNADRVRLALSGGASLGIDLHEPVAVGVDQRGIDIRTRTGVIRLAFPARLDDIAAERFIDSLLTGAPRG